MYVSATVHQLHAEGRLQLQYRTKIDPGQHACDGHFMKMKRNKCSFVVHKGLLDLWARTLSAALFAARRKRVQRGALPQGALPHREVIIGLVTFVIIDRCMTKNWKNRPEVQIRLQLPDTGDSEMEIKHLNIRGVLPNELMEFRVTQHGSLSYLAETYCDGIGRTCTAGEIIFALQGADSREGLRVPSRDFLGPVLASRCEVRLRLGLESQLAIESVRLTAEVT
jgi:hypothetical protein